VTNVRRNAVVALAAVAGAAVGALLARRRSPTLAREAVDPRAEELRRKLDEARMASADEEDFQAAGMGAETIVPEERPQLTPRPERGPEEEFDAMRQRVHEEARAAAEEMRRSAE
jgi:hypothetical protein